MPRGRRRPRFRRGEGSVYYDKTDRTWMADFPTGQVRNGRQVRARRRAQTEDAAKYELEKLRALYSVGDPALMTVGEYLDGWLPAYGASLAPSTRVSYEGHIRLHIKPVLGHIVVGRLERDDVRTLVRNVSRKKAPATVHRVVVTLSCALQQLVDDGKLPDNVCRGVRLPREKSAPVDAMTQDQLDAILAAVKGDPLEPFYRLLAGSGMRSGEACGLNWGDVHTDEGFVIIRSSKTIFRAVPINDDAVAALEDLRAGAAKTGIKDPVFLGPRTGKRLRTWTPSHAFPRLMERAGLGDLHPHLLRHGVATLMVAGGISPRIVAEQLGHKDRGQLAMRTYSHVAPPVLREALRVTVRPR